MFLISGRRREDLERFIGDVPLALVAEHGAWFRESPAVPWEATFPSDPSWKQRIRPILERFVDRVPGSMIEEKDFSLAWHHRAADVASGAAAASELIDTLTSLTANLDLQVLPGQRVVEIKGGGASKGAFYVRRLAAEPWDFVLAIGDDRTDESLFAVLPASAYSIRVGPAATTARFNLDSPDDVAGLLEELAMSAEKD